MKRRRGTRGGGGGHPNKKCTKHLAKGKPKASKAQKPVPITAAKTPARNAPCPCKSGEKFKRCCGKPKPQPVQPRGSPYKNITAQYNAEQQMAAQSFLVKWGFVPNPSQLMTFMEGNDAATTAMVTMALEKLNAEKHFVHAVEKLGHLITQRNQHYYDDNQKKEWVATLAEYEQKCRAEESAITEE